MLLAALYLQVDRLPDNGLFLYRDQRTGIQSGAQGLRIRYHDYEHVAVSREHLFCALSRAAIRWALSGGPGSAATAAGVVTPPSRRKTVKYYAG